MSDEQLLVRLETDELDALRRYREDRDRRAGQAPRTVNPATAAYLSLRDLPRWAMLNAPAANVKLVQVANVDAVLLFGIRTAEGEKIRLTPAERAVLTLIRAVKLGMIRVQGQLDPATIASILGDYRPRIVRAAISRLAELDLIVVERERGRISKILLHPDMMSVPRRPRKGAAPASAAAPGAPPIHRLSTPDQSGSSNTPIRQKNAALLSKRAMSDDNPVVPFSAPPAAPAASPPFHPPHGEEKETLRSDRAGESQMTDDDLALARSGSALNGMINGHGNDNDRKEEKSRSRGWFRRALDAFFFNDAPEDPNP